MRRRREDELLDRTGWDPADLRESLRLVSEMNRTLGGHRLIRDALAGLPCGATVLDVGTGSGDLLVALEDGRRTWGLRVGLDVHPQIVRVAARKWVEPGRVGVLRGDARALPFATDCVDAAICTLTLHHFDPPEAVHILSEMGRVACRRVVVADLARSAWALLGARFLSRTLWRHNPLTRVDGPRSVRGAFTVREVRELARTAGLRAVRVTRHVPYGFLLTARPPGAPIR